MRISLWISMRKFIRISMMISMMISMRISMNFSGYPCIDLLRILDPGRLPPKFAMCIVPVANYCPAVVFLHCLVSP